MDTTTLTFMIQLYLISVFNGKVNTMFTAYILGEVKSRTTTEKEVPRANSEHSGACNILYSSEKEI
jgi:hypothetical protein